MISITLAWPLLDTSDGAGGGVCRPPRFNHRCRTAGRACSSRASSFSATGAASRRPSPCSALGPRALRVTHDSLDITESDAAADSMPVDRADSGDTARVAVEDSWSMADEVGRDVASGAASAEPSSRLGGAGGGGDAAAAAAEYPETASGPSSTACAVPANNMADRDRCSGQHSVQNLLAWLPGQLHSMPGWNACTPKLLTLTPYWSLPHSEMALPAWTDSGAPGQRCTQPGAWAIGCAHCHQLGSSRMLMSRAADTPHRLQCTGCAHSDTRQRSARGEETRRLRTLSQQMNIAVSLQQAGAHVEDVQWLLHWPLVGPPCPARGRRRSPRTALAG